MAEEESDEGHGVTPGLNPIEVFWRELRTLKGSFCKEEWVKTPPEMCANLATNQKCLTALLANKGFSTKYKVTFCLGIKHLIHSMTSKINQSIKSLGLHKLTNSPGDQIIISPNVCCIYMYVCICFNKSCFPIFPAKYSEIRCGSRLLHSTTDYMLSNSLLIAVISYVFKGKSSTIHLHHKQITILKSTYISK